MAWYLALEQHMPLRNYLRTSFCQSRSFNHVVLIVLTMYLCKKDCVDVCKPVCAIRGIDRNGCAAFAIMNVCWPADSCAFPWHRADCQCVWAKWIWLHWHKRQHHGNQEWEWLGSCCPGMAAPIPPLSSFSPSRASEPQEPACVYIEIL